MQTIQPNYNKQNIYVHRRSTTVQNPDSIEAMTADTDRIVKGTFKNLENPGHPGYVGCRLYKGQEIFQKTFMDGEEAEIPLSVARFINEQTQYPIHGFLLDEKGNYVKGTGSMKQRYQFTPSEFK